jgi:hypothetical protein
MPAVPSSCAYGATKCNNIDFGAGYRLAASEKVRQIRSLEKLIVWSRSRGPRRCDGDRHSVSRQLDQERGCQCCMSAGLNWLRAES